MKTSYREVRGITLCFDDWETEGRPVIFMHATGFARGCWRPMAEALAGRCRPILVDLRGHGGSSKAEPPYLWPELAEDIAALITAEGWVEPVLVGHSVGGSIAVEVPGRLGVPAGALVLTEPVLSATRITSAEPSEASPLMERTLRRRSSWPTLAEAEAYFGAREPYTLFAKGVYEGWMATGLTQQGDEWQLSCPPSAEASVYANTQTSRAFESLPNLNCPVLLFRATGSRGMRSTCPDNIARAIPNCTDFLIPGSGHFLPLEYPDMVVALVEMALDRASARA